MFFHLGAIAAALLGFSGVAQTEDTAKPATIAEATQGEANTALWLTGDEDTKIYLLGTIHILEPSIKWRTQNIEEALQSSDVYYFEADLFSQEALQAGTSAMLDKGFDKNGKKFSSYFSKEELSQVNATLASFGLSAEQFQTMRPWFAGLQVAQLAMAKVGGSPDAGVEMVLSRDAMANGKELRFFETLADQVDVFASADDTTQAELFLTSLEELMDVEAYFAEMVGYWYHGDAAALAALFKEAYEPAPELGRRLLDERNEKWADILAELTKTEEGTFFVAVGTAHLAGENSVQDYLIQYGIQTTRLNPIN